MKKSMKNVPNFKERILKYYWLLQGKEKNKRVIAYTRKLNAIK